MRISRPLSGPRRIALVATTLGLLIASPILSWAQEATSTNTAYGVPRELTTQEISDGWLELFDGESLFGWKGEGDANFAVVDHRITVDQGSAPCLLRTTSQFDNYELTVDFRIEDSTNSGVFLRTPPSPTDPTRDCFEVNLAQPPISPFPTGSLVGRASNPIEIDSSQWHRMRMTINGGSISVEVDEAPVTQLQEQRPLGRGFIGLQFNQGLASFCNVFLRPLELDSDREEQLSTWRIGPNPDSLQIDATSDSEIHLHQGPGFLESHNHYGDFVLRLEAKTGVAVNSGVFFRCIPGSNLDGYESQINHVLIDADPTRPADFGTGGIFRRSPARQVWSRDEEWFSKTIVAEGNHFAIWVNGHLVCDWSDSRTADPNPRRGLRTEAGTLALQVHDADTSVWFRNVRVREIEKREK